MGRVLVVDEKFAVRTALAELLTDEGHAVSCARDSGEALLMWDREAGRFDALVVDHDAPGRKGASLAARLRAQSPDLRVVLACDSLTPTPEPIDEPTPIEGALRLAKPVEFASLAAHLRAR